MEKALPKNWVNSSLKEVTRTVKGKKPKIQSEVEFENSIPYMDIKALEYNEIRQFADMDSSKIFEKGDVAMVWDGARSGWVSKTNFGAIGSTIAAFKPIKLNSDYLYYYLLDIYPYLNSNARGVGIPHVDPTVLYDLVFPLAPLAEQQRIVAKLDALFGHLEALKIRLEKVPLLLKNFRQAVLTQAVTGKLTEEWRVGKNLESGLKKITTNRLKHFNERLKLAKDKSKQNPKKLDNSEFDSLSYEDEFVIPDSWEIANLKNIADQITDGEHATPIRTSEGYYLLSARNVQNGFISLENVDYIPESEYLRIKKRCNPEFNDILISCSGSVGRVSIVPKNLEFGMVRSAALIKLQSNIESSKYLEFALRSQYAQKQILKLQKSTAQANLFLGPIGQIVLPIPPIQEQTEIIRRVDSLFTKADAIEAQYQSLKEKINNFPQALLAKAFKGELVEQLPTDGDAKDLLEEIKRLKNSCMKMK